MLKLLNIVPCETLIIAETSHVCSAINMIEKMDISTPPEAPDKFLAPKQWAVMVLWTTYGSDVPDEPVPYEQRVVVFSPEKDEIMVAETLFMVSTANLNYRNTVQLNGFPISITGITTIEVSLKEQAEKEWRSYGEFPIQVVRTPLEANDDNA